MLSGTDTTREAGTSPSDIDHFLSDPCRYFGSSLTRIMSVPRKQLDQLQIKGMKRRFGQFRGRLPMLDKLADSQNIDAIDEIDDVLPLLFPDQVFKSYPATLIDNGRYRELTAWLNKLTTIDLSSVDVSSCRSLDDWMITLSRETPLAVVHTSGTSGSMSFLPRTKYEWTRFIEQLVFLCGQTFGEETPAEPFPLNIDCIYPYFRTGGVAHTVFQDAISEIVAGGEERMHTAFPQRLSADIMLLAARHRAATAKGQLDRLVINPELAARRKDFENLQREMPKLIAEFFSAMQTQLAGKRVFMLAPTNMLHSLAENGLKQGIRDLFAPNSILITGGGGKGTVLPDNWQNVLRDFFGVKQIHYGYGMSEMVGSLQCCEHDHFHVPPWIIPFVLDPDTARPLPRKGAVTGRFAFYDLIPNTHWGGFITGDEVTMEWERPCACGRTTAYVTGTIQRFGEKSGGKGDEKINCAATPAAYAEALDFLNEGTTA